MLEGLSTNPLLACVLLACALFFVAMAGWFVYNALRSIHYTLSVQAAPRIGAVRPFVTRGERLNHLPPLPLPAVYYSLAQERLDAQDLPTGGCEELLDCFERRVLETAKQEQFFARLSTADSGCSSMVIGFHASFLACFVAWIRLEPLGSVVEWHLMCSEVRFWRTPHEEASHFQYGSHQDEHFVKQLKGVGSNDDWLYSIWNFMFSNITTPGMAQKAQWFRQFLVSTWFDALATTDSGGPVTRVSRETSPPPPTAGGDARGDQTQMIHTYIEEFTGERRLHAVDKLRAIGEPAIEPLISALKDPGLKGPYVFLALGFIAGSCAVGSRAVDPLVLCLKTSDGIEQWYAAVALSKIGDNRVIEQLYPATTGQDRHLRLAAAAVLVSCGDDRVTGVLLDALDSQDKVERAYAALALGSLRGERITQRIFQALRDPEAFVRCSVVMGLSKMKDPGWYGALQGALEDSNSSVRRTAAYALGDAGYPWAVEALIPVLRDQDRSVAGTAAEALVKIGPFAHKPLTEASLDPNQQVRELALRSLRELDGRNGSTSVGETHVADSSSENIPPPGSEPARRRRRRD